MSANPQAMAAMLAQGLGGQQQQQGGGGALGAASQLAQKLMLMKALQGQNPQQPPPPQAGPGGFPLPPGQAVPQSMNQQPMPGGLLG